MITDLDHSPALAPRLEEIAARLRPHEWVSQVRAFGPSAGGSDDPETIVLCAVPGTAGIRALRTMGREALILAWKRQLAKSGPLDGVRLVWHITAQLPHTADDCVLQLGRAVDWMPEISAVVVDRDHGRLDCQLRVPLEMQVFRGHFPTHPIVPGVMQVGWAAQLALAHGLSEGPLTGIIAAKFRRLVRPGMHLAAEIVRGALPGSIEFRYAQGEALVAVGRLRMANGHA